MKLSKTLANGNFRILAKYVIISNKIYTYKYHFVDFKYYASKAPECASIKERDNAKR